MYVRLCFYSGQGGKPDVRTGRLGQSVLVPSPQLSTANIVPLLPKTRPSFCLPLELTLMDLNSLKFATTHEWVSVDGDIATMGITDFAVKALTDLVYVDLPKEGTDLNVGDNCGEVESVKAVTDLYAPVSGEIVASNEAVSDDLDLLSNDAFGGGWLLKIRMSNPDELTALMDRATYEAHCESESH